HRKLRGGRKTEDSIPAGCIVDGPKTIQQPTDRNFIALDAASKANGALAVLTSALKRDSVPIDFPSRNVTGLLTGTRTDDACQTLPVLDENHFPNERCSTVSETPCTAHDGLCIDGSNARDQQCKRTQ